MLNGVITKSCYLIMLMKVIRWPIGQLILLVNVVFSPRSPKRAVDEQAKIDNKTHKLSLYQLPSCPFCVKVRRAMKRYGLKIELRNISGKNDFSDELTREGGKRKVPCLRIEKEGGQVQWLYESSDIVTHLKGLTKRA
jgi:glutaredoxin